MEGLDISRLNTANVEEITKGMKDWIAKGINLDQMWKALSELEKKWWPIWAIAALLKAFLSAFWLLKDWTKWPKDWTEKIDDNKKKELLWKMLNKDWIFTKTWIDKIWTGTKREDLNYKDDINSNAELNKTNQQYISEVQELLWVKNDKVAKKFDKDWKVSQDWTEGFVYQYWKNTEEAVRDIQSKIYLKDWKPEEKKISWIFDKKTAEDYLAFLNNWNKPASVDDKPVAWAEAQKVSIDEKKLTTPFLKAHKWDLQTALDAMENINYKWHERQETIIKEALSNPADKKKVALLQSDILWMELNKKQKWVFGPMTLKELNSHLNVWVKTPK